MEHVFYLLLRRLRPPIILIITVYAISILGFVLIPGQDDQGNPVRMDFGHAFYFVSFMGSTIGFGEIPYAFTPAQRVWTTFTLYLTVVSWVYSIGTILALFQEPNFHRLVKRTNFSRRVRWIHEPFFLVCGYGVTGNLLVHSLDSRGIQTVVIDSDQRLLDQLDADRIGLSVPCLCADAADPDVLTLAGIQNDRCVGVLALTNDDHTNLSVAIDSKLVKPGRLVISRTQSKETTANLASFGTDVIIDPFETFADHLILILRDPYKHLIHELIVNPHHNVLTNPHQNTGGRWVICGYGRFGKALEAKFKENNIAMTFIEVDPEMRDAPEGTILGVGTEAETLLQAGIENAVGIIAGTPDDADNLSIIITARDIKPDLITVARQNIGSNKPVFRAADVNLIMESGRIIAHEIYMHIRTPLLMDFFNQLRQCDDQQSRQLLLSITAVLQEFELNVWTLNVAANESPAIDNELRTGHTVKLGFLTRDPRDRQKSIPALALLIKRDGEFLMQPDRSVRLQVGDQVLFCGQAQAKVFMHWTINNHNVLRYIKTGVERPDGLVWRWLYDKQRKRRKLERAS
ncbi:MAG: potassium channel family protein [Pseudomonadales bacterium]